MLTYCAPSALDGTWETMEHGTTEIKNVEAIFFDTNETMEQRNILTLNAEGFEQPLNNL
ncbi:MAG: hypothetical protein ACM3PX_08015 [Omnitrophica WOR_2 bacterium]